MSQNAGQPRSTSGTIARMMTRTLAAAALTTVALGGVVFASSDASQPDAKCKVVSTQTQTQVRAGGVMHRTETTTRCRGKLSVTYTAWS